MSFSADVKAELCAGRIEKRNLAVAECYGACFLLRAFRSAEVRIVQPTPLPSSYAAVPEGLFLHRL